MKNIFILGSKKSLPNYGFAVSICGANAVYSGNPSDSKNCDSLLLTGGGDLNPRLYGEENNFCDDINDEKDRQEYELINLFYGKNKPIFGICRGIQVLNVFFGGTLSQHVENPILHSRCGLTRDKLHEVESANTNILTKLYSSKFIVNSAHHQAIKNIAPDFTPMCYSGDDIIEGIYHKEKPIFAVQFHPERMFDCTGRVTCDGKQLFRYFISL